MMEATGRWLEPEAHHTTVVWGATVGDRIQA